MNDEERKIEQLKFKMLLSKLGFDVNLVGYVFFEELVFEVRELLREGKNDEQVKEMIPILITEYGSCYHEIGRKKYIMALEEFFSKRKSIQLDKYDEKEFEIINIGTNISEKLLGFSKTLNEKTKVKIKTLNEVK